MQNTLSLDRRSLRWRMKSTLPMIGLLVIAWVLNLVFIVGELYTNVLVLPSDYGIAFFALWLFPLSFMVLWQQIYIETLIEGGLGVAPELTAVATLTTQPNSGQEPYAVVKYSRSALDDERSQRIVGKIERAMSTDHLYRNQQLNLRNLSDHVKVTENYLSQALNGYLGRSFYEYVNHL